MPCGSRWKELEEHGVAFAQHLEETLYWHSMVEHIMQGDKESMLAQVSLILQVIHVNMVAPLIITSQRPQLQVLLINKSWKCWIHELRWATLKPPHRVWLRQELGFGVGFGNIPHMLLIVRSVLAMGPVASGLLGVRGRICLNRTYICA